MTDQPKCADHINEFNAVVSEIFTQLYASFPMPVDIDLSDVKTQCSHIDIKHVLLWLTDENYVRSLNTIGISKGHPSQLIVLTASGLAAFKEKKTLA